MNDEYGNGGMEGKEPGGYCIEIYVGADNQVKGVKVEQKTDQGGAEVEMEAKMPAQSIDEALSMAKGIFENGGQPAGGAGQQGQESAQDAQMRGYGKGSFANQRGGMPVNKVFTDTM